MEVVVTAQESHGAVSAIAARPGAVELATGLGPVMLIRNSKSGRGRAPRVTGSLIDQLRASGRDVRLLDAGPELTESRLRATVAGCSALVVVGGDGTLHHTLDTAVRCVVPVYHVPLGNENLFAREFGMGRDWAGLLSALEHNEARQVDLGSVNGRYFALMVSAGFDAAVVQRVAGKRKGGVWHGDYVRHGVAELLASRWPRMRLIVDDRSVVENGSGLVIVANSRQYAARLDPARAARMDDGKLDVVFLPARNRVTLARWGVALLAGRDPLNIGGTVVQGTTAVLEAVDEPVPYQIDGEFGGVLGSGSATAVAPDGEPVRPNPTNGIATSLSFKIHPGVLSVLHRGPARPIETSGDGRVGSSTEAAPESAGSHIDREKGQSGSKHGSNGHNGSHR